MTTGLAKSGRVQLARLLRLITILQSNAYPSSVQLAQECEVSRRTIFRDFDALELAGIEIEYVPDRGGYKIHWGQPSPAQPLLEEEVSSMIVLAQFWGGRDGLGLLGQARSGLIKAIQAFPTDARNRLSSIQESLEPKQQFLERTPRRQNVYDGLLASLIRRVQVKILFQVHPHQATEWSKVSPFRLVLSQRMWCMIGRSSLHKRVELFRVPYILELESTNEPYVIPSNFDTSSFLDGAWIGDPSISLQEIWLRFSERVGPLILDRIWHPDQILEPLKDGRVDLRILSRSTDDLVHWILGYGEEVEVLSPETLRQTVRDSAYRVWTRHSPRKMPINTLGNGVLGEDLPKASPPEIHQGNWSNLG